MISSILNKFNSFFSPPLTKEEEDEILKDYFNLKKEQVSNSTGVITKIALHAAEIDHRYIFPLTSYAFKVGDKITYKINKKGVNVEITDVELIKQVNEIEESKETLLACYVVEIDGDNVTVSPGGYCFNRNQVDFEPEIGDYFFAEGEFKGLDNYKITKVTPSECKLISGLIMTYDEERGVGQIGGGTYFSKNVCDNFTPKKLISVFGTAVKSSRFNSTWRATKLTLMVKANFNKIEISRTPAFSLGFGEKRTLDVQVYNYSKQVVEIGQAEISSTDSNIKFTKIPEAAILAPNGSVIYSIECCGTHLGKSAANVRWKFGKIVVSRTVKFETILLSKNVQSGRMLFQRRGRMAVPNFITVRMASYNLPDEIITMEGESLFVDSMKQAQEIFPVLSSPLNAENYTNILHTLLYLEEHQINENMKALTNNFCLYPRNDYVVLEYEADSPHSNLAPGDSVLISKPWDDVQFLGKIFETSSNTIAIKLHPQFMNDYRPGALYTVEFKQNRTQMRKKHYAIDAVVKFGLLDRVFPVPLVEDYELRPVEFWFDNNLNNEQKLAVQSILDQKNKTYPYIIFGPPGTGKTVTLVELILQLCHQPESRILVCAPTNSAIDLIGLRLVENGYDKSQMIRFASYRCLKQGNIPAELADITFMPSLFEEVPGFNDEQIPICTKHSIGHHKVTLGTLTCIGTLCGIGLPPGFFTHVIIDEAGQCSEPESLIPMTFLDKTNSQLVLAGDPLQLGPVLMSTLANQFGLKLSLLGRLTSNPVYSKTKTNNRNLEYDNRVITKLVVNYRALPKLVRMISDVFYDSELVPHVSDQDSKEMDLLKTLILDGQPLRNEKKSIIFFDVDGIEEQMDGSWSWYNKSEILKVVLLINQLYKTVPPENIGIITPYNLQAKKIDETLEGMRLFSPKIGSVEEFQGAEREIIIFSLVRNSKENKKYLPEFLMDRQKINVALSRARVLNIIVGSKDYMQIDPLWKKIITYCE